MRYIDYFCSRLQVLLHYDQKVVKPTVGPESPLWLCTTTVLMSSSTAILRCLNSVHPKCAATGTLIHSLCTAEQ